jgi:uncharacterized protein (DUF302 family)
MTLFHYTVETSKNVEEAVQSVEESLKNHKFGVLWQFDITSKLQEKGIDFHQPYRVLEVCNPAEAARVLSKNSLMGYFLPCKVVVYTDNGKTKIGLPKPSVLVEIVSDKNVKEIARRVEETLIMAINEAK